MSRIAANGHRKRVPQGTVVANANTMSRAFSSDIKLTITTLETWMWGSVIGSLNAPSASVRLT